MSPCPTGAGDTDEKEILEVTGLPPSPPLENMRVPVSYVESRRDGK